MKRTRDSRSDNGSLRNARPERVAILLEAFPVPSLLLFLGARR